ncbi:MAG: thioredoxin family protein [Sulfurimonas sp.]|nr:thioredoxin family protein [Sulfurimonas sp.]
MKIVFFLFMSISLFSAHLDTFANEMNFHRDYKTALIQAKEENKLLVMVLSADYCPWCRKFENKTLKSKLIKDRLSNEVVTLVVDQKYDVKLFPKKFETKITPRIFFINPSNEKSLFDEMGYIKKKEFSKLLDVAYIRLKNLK